MRHFRRVYWLLCFLALAYPSTAAGGDVGGVVVIDAPAMPRSQKEALLILPGFGSKTEGLRDIRDYFSHRGYDLFIPSYIERDTIAHCIDSLDRFLQEQKLDEYRSLHVFNYILGGWTLNLWLLQHPANNIVTIVYDRSPLQERAASAMVRDSPFLTRLAAGPIVEEFAKTPYPPVPNDQRNIGIIMESRASKLVRKHKQSALSFGEVSWDVSDRKQDCDDYFYTLNNHDEMYHDFKVVGPEVLRFIRNGKFSPRAPRVRPDVDPFAEEKPAEAAREDGREHGGDAFQGF